MTSDKELLIEVDPHVQAQMDKDPELARAMKDLFACFHQAAHAVRTGQYESFDEAMEAITGSRIHKLSPEEVAEIVNEMEEGQ